MNSESEHFLLLWKEYVATFLGLSKTLVEK